MLSNWNPFGRGGGGPAKRRASLRERAAAVRSKPLRTENIFSNADTQVLPLTWEEFGDQFEADINKRARDFFSTEELTIITEKVRAQKSGNEDENLTFSLNQSVLYQFRGQNWKLGGHVRQELAFATDENGELCRADEPRGKPKGCPLLSMDNPAVHPLMEDAFDQIFASGITEKDMVSKALVKNHFRVNHTHVTHPFYDHYVATVGQDSGVAAGPTGSTARAKAPPPIDTNHVGNAATSSEQRTPEHELRRQKAESEQKAARLQAEQDQAIAESNAHRATNATLATAHGKLADAVHLNAETEAKRVAKEEKEQEHRAALNDRLATMVEKSQSTIDCQQKTIHNQQQQIANGTPDGSVAARSCGSSASALNRKKAAPLKTDEDSTDMSALSDDDSGSDDSVLSDNKDMALAAQSSTTRRGASKKTAAPSKTVRSTPSKTARSTPAKTARSTPAKTARSTPAKTTSRSKPPLPPSRSKTPKQGPANVKKHAGCRTPRDDTSTTSSTPRRGKRSASPLGSDPDAKRPARGLPAAGTVVQTHDGLTGKVHESVAKARSLVPVVLDGCNGMVQKFQVSNLEWED